MERNIIFIFLMDHYSKIILGYSIENSSSPKAIKNLLQEAYLEHKNKDVISLVTDDGVENVNSVVKGFLRTTNFKGLNLICIFNAEYLLFFTQKIFFKKKNKVSSHLQYFYSWFYPKIRKILII
ncbi:hypothetical protein [Flavobacterium undicola]|uniref:hypothetical protein n=1 Tax=Flavobacterium undicola TaxID=1932779 RepID=UPI0013765613|nr:hypothetical protein [Flavobacterium undicola]MBA0882474.1 hypothetical protein [Flavobacterium undicola]